MPASPCGAAAPRARRSLIFVPGDRPDRFAGALACGADQVCVELEDGVPRRKDEARANALAFFAAAPAAAGDGPERLLRVNSPRTAHGLRDLVAICESPAPPPAIMVPKVESPAEIRLLADLFRGGAHGGVRFHVVIETAAALEAAHEIALAGPRIDALAFGAFDLAAELRASPGWGPMLYARQRLACAAAAAGIDLLDAPSLDLADEAGLANDARRARGLGFTGKAAIHPRQIAAINAAFTPSAEEAARARAAIAASEAAGGELAVVDGKLIEPPVLRAMRRVAAAADRAPENAAAADRAPGAR